jgi:hypothetical protein
VPGSAFSMGSSRTAMCLFEWRLFQRETWKMQTKNKNKHRPLKSHARDSCQHLINGLGESKPQRPLEAEIQLRCTRNTNDAISGYNRWPGREGSRTPGSTRPMASSSRYRRDSPTRDRWRGCLPSQEPGEPCDKGRQSEALKDAQLS